MLQIFIWSKIKEPCNGMQPFSGVWRHPALIKYAYIIFIITTKLCNCLLFISHLFAFLLTFLLHVYIKCFEHICIICNGIVDIVGLSKCTGS